MPYDEFRIQLSPVLATAGAAGESDWMVQVLDAPLPALVGPKGSITPAFTRDQLKRLRSPSNWPNLAELKQISDSVWKSMMNAKTEAAFLACLDVAKANARGLRVVVVTEDQQVALPSSTSIRLSELPVEALRCDQLNFLAQSVETPVSRSFKAKADAPPLAVTLPIRILVVIASPNDQAPVDVAKERATIEKAMKPLVDSGVVALEILTNATRSDLQEKLERPFHIVHFITHGNFDVAGDDPSTRAFLCLQSDTGETAALDSNLLDALLRNNTKVRLVVITACSSAQPAPVASQQLYGISAFDGIAQRLVASASSVSAVVAMQFDFEMNAAAAFNGAFYRNLLQPGKTLDDALVQARLAIASKLEMGHRAWINPALYWRCRDGQVFDIQGMHSGLDEQTRNQIAEIDAEIDRSRKQLESIAGQPPAIRAALQVQTDEHTRRIETLSGERSLLLGNSVRLLGDRAKPGERVSCRLTLKLRTPTLVGAIRVKVKFPQQVVTLAGHKPGSHVGAVTVDAPAGGTAGILQVQIADASAGNQWIAGEYELCQLDFKVVGSGDTPACSLQLVDLQVDSIPALSYSTMDGIVFVAPNGA